MDNNNDTVTEGNIIDVEPEQEETKESSEANKLNPSSKKPALAILLSVIALIAICLLFLAGLRYWQNMSQDLIVMQQRIDASFSEQKKLNSAINSTKALLQQQQQNLDEQAQKVLQQSQQLQQDRAEITLQTETMQHAVAQVSEKIDRSKDQWQIAEAEYLLRIANLKLALNGDRETALTALKQADQLLHASGDLGLLTIRGLISDEIAQLNAVPQIDIVGIASTLQSLSHQVSQLKLSGATLSLITPEEATKKPVKERSLDTLLADSWRGFKNLVVIRKHDQPVTAMLSPDQQFFITQNMTLQLESARLALLKQNETLFISSLDTALDSLKQFYDPQDNLTKSMKKSLISLKKITLNPSLPNISHSLKRLTQYRQVKK